MNGHVDRVTNAAIEDKIFGLLARRHDGATIFPSELARTLVSESESFSVANGLTGGAEVFDDLMCPSMCRALVARNRG